MQPVLKNKRVPRFTRAMPPRQLYRKVGTASGAIVPLWFPPAAHAVSDSFENQCKTVEQEYSMLTSGLNAALVCTSPYGPALFSPQCRKPRTPQQERWNYKPQERWNYKPQGQRNYKPQAAVPLIGLDTDQNNEHYPSFLTSVDWTTPIDKQKSKSTEFSAPQPCGKICCRHCNPCPCCNRQSATIPSTAKASSDDAAAPIATTSCPTGGCATATVSNASAFHLPTIATTTAAPDPVATTRQTMENIVPTVIDIHSPLPTTVNSGEYTYYIIL